MDNYPEIKKVERERNRKAIFYSAGAIGVIGLVILAINIFHKPDADVACKLQPFRQDQAASLVEEGAVIAFERNGGANCIDELYAIYPDGRIAGDNGIATNRKAGNSTTSTRIAFLYCRAQSGLPTICIRLPTSHVVFVITISQLLYMKVRKRQWKQSMVEQMLLQNIG